MRLVVQSVGARSVLVGRRSGAPMRKPPQERDGGRDHRGQHECAAARTRPPPAGALVVHSAERLPNPLLSVPVLFLKHGSAVTQPVSSCYRVRRCIGDGEAATSHAQTQGRVAFCVSTFGEEMGQLRTLGQELPRESQNRRPLT